jgi:Predicted EndoIII-related endonuclease
MRQLFAVVFLLLQLITWNSVHSFFLSSFGKRINKGSNVGLLVTTAGPLSFCVKMTKSSLKQQEQNRDSNSSSSSSSDNMMRGKNVMTQQFLTMTYREMQKLCKQNGLAANGTKEVVRTRLLNFYDDTTTGKSKYFLDNSKNNSKNNKEEEDKEYLHKKYLPRTLDSRHSTVPAKEKTTITASKSATSKTTTTTTTTILTLTDTTFSSPVKTTRSSNNKNASSSSTPSSSSPRKKQKILPGSLEPPNNWEVIYSIVEELRADKSAPLDTDGGEAVPERHLGDKVYRFQVLVALMLSSQTKDAVVGETMRILQKHGLTVDNIHATDAKTLNALIRKVGFHNNKTKYLKQVAEILVRDYDSDIPPTVEEMMKLPGVGPKMAYIIENVAFGRSTGIGVDTHMHRIFNDLKWVQSKTPEQTREQLEGWLPFEKWGEVNMLWVGFGQESQQQKEKIIKKALRCSRPVEALNLLQTVGVDVIKEAKKLDLTEEVEKFWKGNE